MRPLLYRVLEQLGTCSRAVHAGLSWGRAARHAIDGWRMWLRLTTHSLRAWKVQLVYSRSSQVTIYCMKMAVCCDSLCWQQLVTLYVEMPPKRSAMQSPNPVKHQTVSSDEEVLTTAGGPAYVTVDPCEASSEIVLPATIVTSAVVDAPLSTPPMSPPRSVAGGSSAVSAPLSPATPRDRFLDGRTPVRICCNLDLMRAPAGASPDPDCVMVVV
jgi:hypothetical protein